MSNLKISNLNQKKAVMTPTHLALLKAVENIVREADDLNIVSEDITEQMVLSLTSFVLDAANKFVIGQQEHGGDIRSRNLNTEIKNEIIDLFWYNGAANWKK